MECSSYNENGFLLLDELLRSDSWETSHFPIEINDFHYNNSLINEYFGENPIANTSIPSTTTISTNSSFEENSNFPFDHQSLLNYSLINSELDTCPFTIENFGNFHNFEVGNIGCKLERSQSNEAPTFNIGFCQEKKMKIKKVNGQPSKNLMAERRRRTRLNDRLSMLRSIVPKISKMDRTSILGDTIDYTKELLERINNLQQEIELISPNQLSLMSIFKNEKPIEMFVRNSPKFDVERRNNIETRVEINCAGKSDLLLSTLTTLDSLGQDIQQCVISSFSDFAMQASCSEEMEQRGVTNEEEIKQALFRNTGYGGRCL